MYKLYLYIITHFEHRQCFIWRILVFSFLVLSLYKNPKSNHYLIFLAIFPELEMLQFWFIYARSVNYTFILDMSEILDNTYIWMFLVNSESVLAFVRYMLYNHCYWKLYFFVLFGGQKPLFCDEKLFKIFWCFVFHNSGTVGRRKLSDPSLNRIFNTLPVGVQFTHLFQWTNFCLKCLIILWNGLSLEKLQATVL